MSWLYALWFFLPAGVANATPVFVNKIPILNKWKTPLDLGLSFRSKRLLGPNKTIRGLLAGTLLGMLVGALQQKIGLVGFHETSWLIGGALGFGALLGDAVESFFKRQIGVASGEAWFPFDQTDYIIGGLVFALPFSSLSLIFCIQVLVMWFGIHLVSAFIGYKLGLKDKPI